MKGKSKILLGVILLFLISSFVVAAEFKLNVQEYTLKNGLELLMVEKYTAPVVSCVVRFKVGSVDEWPGITGTSHLLEHMLFKGTKNIGTWNYAAEVPLMKEIDQIAAQMEKEEKSLQNPLAGRDETKLKQLREKLRELQKKQKQYIIKDELWETYLKNGGAGLNASTFEDGTQYFLSLPANRLELWAYIESDRMREPVLREFYSERDVVFEERRLRTDTQPMGKLWEQFAATAFTAHPYGWPVVGWASDISTVKREQVQEYFRNHYSPNNAVIAVVGDINPQQVIGLVEKYFADIPAQPAPEPVFTSEPEQRGERRIEVEFDANPQMLIGYHMPQAGHPDSYVLDVIASILSRGRTSRFYKNLVEDKKIALTVTAFSNQSRYPDLFTIQAMPLAPHTTPELEEAIYQEIEKLKVEPVSSWELEKTRNQLEADFIRSLNSNTGLAFQLTNYQAVTGSWKFLQTLKEERKKVTPEEIMRVAQKYLTKSNRTVATLVKTKSETKTASLVPEKKLIH